MYHDLALAAEARACRPKSAVSAGVGVAGLAGMALWIVVARALGMDGPYAALANLAACGIPMVLWAVLVDKVHRAPTTGIDWGQARLRRESVDISLAKLAGLWLTWAGIAAIYAVMRFYWEGGFGFAMWCLEMAAPAVFLLSIPYVFWLDRYLIEPKDGAWALGAWVLGLEEPIDREAIYNHLRAWAVKGFFLAFMLSIVPPGFGDFVRWDLRGIWADPIQLANWLITFMFTVDVAFATIGYILTFRPLDAHIRTANPYAGAWAAALICYPPFILMNDMGPLDYHVGTADWTHWFAAHPLLLWATGAVLVGLTAIYAWATVAFGFRFSNLTHRGVLTHGPYAWSRHPAYLSKNLFWWIATIPMLATTGSWTDAARNTAVLAMVSGVYFIRAKTEERHLKADPVYWEYWDWAGRHAPVPQFFGWVFGRKS